MVQRSTVGRVGVALWFGMPVIAATQSSGAAEEHVLRAIPGIGEVYARKIAGGRPGGREDSAGLSAVPSPREIARIAASGDNERCRYLILNEPSCAEDGGLP